MITPQSPDGTSTSIVFDDSVVLHTCQPTVRICLCAAFREVGSALEVAHEPWQMSGGGAGFAERATKGVVGAIAASER